MTIKYNHNDWFEATVENSIDESPSVKSFFFRVPHPLTHLAGQHYELRLTAENGYQATRLYSAATAGNGTTVLQLTIMNVPNGEVSPYVSQSLKEGDTVEIRGPFGKFFVWTPDETRPVLLIGGGSGVVPMHAIFTTHKQSGSAAPMKLLYSARHFEDILYKPLFIDAVEVTITLTQEQSSDWKGLRGRISKSIVQNTLGDMNSPLCYICGMSPFVDAVSNQLIDLGIPAKDILAERYG